MDGIPVFGVAHLLPGKSAARAQRCLSRMEAPTHRGQLSTAAFPRVRRLQWSTVAFPGTRPLGTMDLPLILSTQGCLGPNGSCRDKGGVHVCLSLSCDAHSLSSILSGPPFSLHLTPPQPCLARTSDSLAPKASLQECQFPKVAFGKMALVPGAATLEAAQSHIFVKASSPLLGSPAFCFITAICCIKAGGTTSWPCCPQGLTSARPAELRHLLGSGRVAQDIAGAHLSQGLV